VTVTKRTFSIPAAELFEVLVEPTTYPRWLVGAKKIREVSPQWPQPGSYFKHTVGFGPIAIPDRTTVRELQRPRLLVLFVRARPLIEAVVRFEVNDVVGGCELVMTEQPAGVYKLAAPLTQPLVRLRNERSLQRLQDVVDSVGAAA
jgi:uncharacterized protein YndB with AHSA1/START domain